MVTSDALIAVMAKRSRCEFQVFRAKQTAAPRDAFGVRCFDVEPARPAIWCGACIESRAAAMWKAERAAASSGAAGVSVVSIAVVAGVVAALLLAVLFLAAAPPAGAL